MAERFARGGRLVAFGASAADRSDVRHVAVEFVHPVIVGKRALPALGLERRPTRRCCCEADDIAMAFGTGPRSSARWPARGARLRDRRLRARGRASGAGAADARTRSSRQEAVETAYHVLWELVHVFFEHRGLLAGRTAEPMHDPGASSFLYPFLTEREDDLEAVLADVRASVLLKAARGRRAARADPRRAPRALRAAAADAARGARRGRPRAGARQRRLGDRRDGRRRRPAPSAGATGWPARRALDLTEDPAILTAIANDIGAEAVFARQVIATGARATSLLAISTSGGSANVLAALAEARRRGLVTLALVGYDGGRIAAEGLADHVVVSRVGAHPAHPGGAGHGAARAARADRGAARG